MRTGDRIELCVLVVDAIVLALLELFFLPLRFDGTLLPAAGGAPFPVSALAAALTVPLLVRIAGRLSPRAAVAGAPLYAWVIVVVGLGVVSGPGADIVLPGDWRALLLVGGGAIPGALMLGSVLGKARSSRGRAVNTKQ